MKPEKQLLIYTENVTVKQTDPSTWSNQVAVWNQKEKQKRLKVWWTWV